MRKMFLISLFLTALTVLYANTLMAQIYSDSFEGGTIDLFWDTAGLGTNKNGGVELSNQQSHTGSQSLKIYSTGYGSYGNSNVLMNHHFDQAMYGDYSVWFYDPGHGGMYSYLTLESNWIGVQDWDWVFYHANGQTTFPRSLGWHEFKGHVDLSGTKLYIDNTLVYSDSVPVGFNNLGLYMNTNFPTEVWYDDFNMVVYPVMPREAKEQTRDALLGLLPTGDKKTDQRLEKAIEDLDKSLSPELWVDGSHLTMKGEKVFKEEKKAVNELTKIKNAPSEVSGAIDSLVAADLSLAQTALDEAVVWATALGCYAEEDTDFDCMKILCEISKAQGDMDKAQTEWNQGNYDKAIEHFKKAWHHAQKAMDKFPEEVPI